MLWTSVTTDLLGPSVTADLLGASAKVDLLGASQKQKGMDLNDVNVSGTSVTIEMWYSFTDMESNQSPAKDILYQICLYCFEDDNVYSTHTLIEAYLYTYQCLCVCFCTCVHTCVRVCVLNIALISSAEKVCDNNYINYFAVISYNIHSELLFIHMMYQSCFHIYLFL